VRVSEVDTDHEEPADERSAPPLLLAVAMGIVAAAYLAVGAFALVVAVGELLGWGWDNAFMRPGMTPSNAREQLQSDLLTLTVLGAAVAAVGMLLALWGRRPVALALFGAGVVVALAVGLSARALVSPDEPDRPDWEDRPRGCVELSGEPSDCP
jgi:hypothetical protein